MSLFNRDVLSCDDVLIIKVFYNQGLRLLYSIVAANLCMSMLAIKSSCMNVNTQSCDLCIDLLHPSDPLLANS